MFKLYRKFLNIKTITPIIILFLFIPYNLNKNAVEGIICNETIQDIVDDISNGGVSFIKKFEGFVPNAYLDTDGQYIIGYGTRIPDESYMTKKISEKKATQLLKKHVTQHVTPVINKYVKIPLTQLQFDALSSLIYNIGTDKFIKSRLLKEINKSNDSMIKKNWSEFNTASGIILKGLVKRRNEEIKMFFLDKI